MLVLKLFVSENRGGRIASVRPYLVANRESVTDRRTDGRRVNVNTKETFVTESPKKSCQILRAVLAQYRTVVTLLVALVGGG